jgi:hypothetical protein
VTRAVAGAARDKTNIVRRWFEDTGVFTGAAIALFLLGSLFLGADVQSPSKLQWTGTAVHAVEDGGIAFYSFGGQNYTLNVASPQDFSSTVYLDPAEPSNAMFGNALLRWTEFATVGGVYIAAALLLTLGFARRSRRRRRRMRLGDRDPGLSFGSGLDDGTVGRLLDRQRQVDGPD